MNSNKRMTIWKSTSRKVKSSAFVLNELDYQERPTKKKRKYERNENDYQDIKNEVNSLKDQSNDLVADDKYEEAVERLNEAKNLLPEDETIYEMLSQIYMLTRQDFQAIKHAEKVVELKRIWWIGWQTLGRAQMNYGDVCMAIKSFSRAIHLNPHDRELRTEDLDWAVSIKDKQSQNENA